MKLILLSLFCSLSLFAKTCPPKETCPKEACPKETCPKPCCDEMRRPLAVYELYDCDSSQFGARADILYMIYNSPILTYASEQSVANQTLTSEILNVPGKLSLGCDVALLYRMNGAPGYLFEAGWYHIVAQFSRKVSAPNIVPAHIVALGLAAPGTANIHAHTAINLFDLLIKKEIYFGDWFAMSPAAGLVGGYMNGKSNASFNATTGAFSASSPGATTVASLNYTTKFEGIGLKLGGESAFKIGCGFKLKTMLYYNVMYGFSKIKLNYRENGLTTVVGGNVNSSQALLRANHGRAFFDSLLGLSWDHLFCRSKVYIDLHAGWRFQSYSDGWKEFEAELNDAAHELSLTGQGLQAGATIKF